MKNIFRIITFLFFIVVAVKAEAWDPLNWWPTDPMRQEVCDYLNDKLKGHFDHKFENLAQAIKKKYPKVTACQTTVWNVSIDDNNTSGSGEYPAETIFDLADQAVNDIYNPKSNLKEVPVHRDFSCFLAHDQCNVTVSNLGADAAIKLSIVANQVDPNAPVIATLGDPKTGSQRDTSGWTYAIGYRKDWHEELPVNPTRQEVCDYLNDKLKGHFDPQFETLAQAIKDQYPNITRCETVSRVDFQTLPNSCWLGYSSGNCNNQTIFDLADQVVNNFYNPKSKLGETPVHCIYSCLVEHDPKYSGLCGGIDSSAASIQFSPVDGGGSTLGVPVTAILGDPKTGDQRDTYGWTYAIKYQENAQ